MLNQCPIWIKRENKMEDVEWLVLILLCSSIASVTTFIRCVEWFVEFTKSISLITFY